MGDVSLDYQYHLQMWSKEYFSILDSVILRLQVTEFFIRRCGYDTN